MRDQLAFLDESSCNHLLCKVVVLESPLRMQEKDLLVLESLECLIHLHNHLLRRPIHEKEAICPSWNAVLLWPV